MIKVRASGDMGTEAFELQIDGQTVFTHDVGTSFTTYYYRADSTVTADQVRIVFSDDQYDPSNDIDANLNVDRITIDGQRFSTDDASVFSTGTWLSADGGEPGFGRGETLNVNGYFQYGGTGAGNTILVRASGDEGTESFVLQVNGQTIATQSVGTDFQIYSFQISDSISPDGVRVVFSSDTYDPANGIDTNLNVDWVDIVGTKIQTDSPSVYSTGTWLIEDGVQPGNGEGKRFTSRAILNTPSSTSCTSSNYTTSRLSRSPIATNVCSSGPM